MSVTITVTEVLQNLTASEDTVTITIAETTAAVGAAIDELNDIGDVTITTPANGEVLKYNGSAWVNDTVAGAGTVTSVAATMPTGWSVSGSPITSSGTLAFTYASGYQAFTTAESSKLSGIESGATADQSAGEIMTALQTVDGTGSGLDADLLDGNHASAFATASHTHTASEVTDFDTEVSNNITVIQSQGTGILTGGVLSIGTGGAGVATTFTIAAGTGQIVDNTVNPNTQTAISWSAKTDVAVTNILTQLVTFVAIDSGGNVIQSGTDFTPAQMRQYIVIGVVVHSNQTTVNAVNQAQIVAYNNGNQMNDLFYSLGLFNISGNVFSANGANLKLNKSAGSLFRRGSNYTTLSDNPHVITTGSLTQASLRMQNQTGAGSASTTDVDVANYDVGGTTTAISPATRFSVLRVFLFQSNLVAVQRGQATYLSLAEAKAAIQTEAFVTNSVLAANGLLRGFIVAQANATDLSDSSKVFFIEAGKFGGSSGVGGLSVSTLQNAYDNSLTPEILTDSTRGALSVRRGSAADTDTVIEVLNNASSVTFDVDGNGQINSAALTASEIVITDANKNIASAPVATYPSLTELSYVKGVTSAIQTQINSKANTSHTHSLADVTDVTATATELNVLDGIPGTLTATELGYVDGVTSAIQTQLDGKQPLDSDLTTIAGLTATTDNFIQAKSSAWASRTVAQVTTDLQSTGLVADSVGFRNIPQNSQSANYTTVAADSGKHILHPASDANARTFTIDSNANVAYPIGTAITFINMTSQVVTIAITSDTMYLIGAGTTGSRSLAQYGSATALKIATTTWVISGINLT